VIKLITGSLGEGGISRRKWDAGEEGSTRKLFTAACTPRRSVHSSLPLVRDDAVAASYHHPSPLPGASVSVGERSAWNGRGWREVTHALAQTHLLIIVLIVLVQTLVVIIFILKVLVIESFAVEEVDSARNNLGCARVIRLLRRKQ